MNNLPRTGTERTEATAPWVRLLTPLLACLGLVPASLGADIPDYVIVETNNVQVGGKSVSLEYKWECSCIDGEIDWVSIDAVSPKFFGSLEIPADFYIESYPFFLSVGRLEDGLFSNHKSIAEVIFPACTVEVGDGICSNCTSLASVTLQDGLWALGRNPFYGSMIQSLALPRTLQFLDGNPVAGCANLTSLSVDEANSNFTVLDGLLLLGEENTRLIACLPKSKEVTIPATVTSIDEDAFSGCRQLKQVTMLCNVPTAADAIFSDTPASLIVKVDNSVKTCWKDWIGKTWHGRNVADSTCDAERELKTDGTWYYHIVDGYAELWCTNGTGEHVCALVNQQTTGDLELPAAIGGYIVKSIAPLALSNLRGIKSVTFADDSSYENIGDYAFSNSTSLASVTIGSGVTSLGKAPFYGAKITALDLPNSLTTLDGNPLVGCPLVTAITADNTAFKAEDGLLYNAAQTALLACVPNKTSATVPATVDTIAADAFAECKSLTEAVFLGDEPWHVGSDVFGDTPATMVVKADTYLKDWGNPPPATWNGRTLVNVGGLYDDGNAVWSYTVSGNAATITSVSSATEAPLTRVTFPANIGRYTVKTIGASALANQIALTSVSIPSTYETIGDFVFSNCTSLAEITIPNGIRYIGNRPFVNTIVQEISLPDTLLDMYGNVAAGALFDTAIYIGSSSHFVKSDDGCIYNKDKTRLYCCPGCAEAIELPETLTEIMPEAFYGCFRLTHLEIPATVATIGSKAFNVSGLWTDVPALESKPLLEKVSYLGLPPTNVADDIYEGSPATLTSYATADEWKALLPTWKGRSLVVSDKPVTDTTWTDASGNVWKYSVSDNTATIEDVTLATGIETSLTTPNIIGKYPVTAIADGAFSKCKSVETVSLPDGILSLGKAPFSGTNLKSLQIPYTVETIDGNPLVGCRYAKAVEVADENLSFSSSDGILFNKAKSTLLACVPSATEITLPETLETIANDAFSGCRSLRAVSALCDEPDADDAIFTDTPDDLTVMADAYLLDWGDPNRDDWKGRKFENTGVPLPVGPQNYTDESGVEWTYIVRADRTIEIGTTQQAVPTTTPGDISIPETFAVTGYGYLPVVTIGAKAFNGCANITSLSIPSGVTSIQPGAFNGCSDLKSFTVASANTAYKANSSTGALFSKDGKTLVKVPATFEFKTVYTITTATTTMTLEERQLTVNKSGKLSKTITIVPIGTPDTKEERKTETSDPVPHPSTLFNNVELIADYAFTDCGFVAAVKPEMTATTNNVGAVSGPDPEHYADTSYSLLTITKKVTTVTTTTTAEVPVPEIPSTVVCSRLAFAGSAWEGQVPVATLPELGANPTSAQIATVLSPAADERLATNITKVEDYNDFSAWASSVKSTSGEPAGQDAVMNSTAAWTTFALDLDVLPETAPTSDDVKIEEYSQVSGTSDFRLLLSIDDMKIGPNAVAERLKTVFDISGASTLNASDFSADNVDLVFEAPVDGKVPVTAKPANTSTTSFFIKAGLK